MEIFPTIHLHGTGCCQVFLGNNSGPFYNRLDQRFHKKPKKVTKLSRSNHALMCLDKFMALKEYIRGGQKSKMVILEGNLFSCWKGFDLDMKIVKVSLR